MKKPLAAALAGAAVLAAVAATASGSPKTLYTALLKTAYPNSQLPSGFSSAKVGPAKPSSKAQRYHVVGEVGFVVNGPDPDAAASTRSSRARRLQGLTSPMRNRRATLTRLARFPATSSRASGSQGRSPARPGSGRRSPAASPAWRSLTAASSSPLPPTRPRVPTTATSQPRSHS